MSDFLQGHGRKGVQGSKNKQHLQLSFGLLKGKATTTAGRSSADHHCRIWEWHTMHLIEMLSYFDGNIPLPVCVCVCVRASLPAQECWHQVCSPDRQLHCSGVFNMPHQDPSVLEALKKIRKKVHRKKKTDRKNCTRLTDRGGRWHTGTSAVLGFVLTGLRGQNQPL